MKLRLLLKKLNELVEDVGDDDEVIFFLPDLPLSLYVADDVTDDTISDPSSYSTGAKNIIKVILAERE